MSMKTLDDLLSGGLKTAKFETVGQVWSGPVVSVEVRQATNFDTGKPEFWDDGAPKQQVVVAIQTAQRADEDDDGVRAIYIKAWGEQMKAFRAASAAVKSKPEPGDTFTATYTGDGPKPVKGFAPKLFRYEIRKGSAVDALLGGNQAAPAASEPVVTPPPAPAALAAGPLDTAAKVQQFMELGLNDEQIGTALSLPTAAITAIRGNALQAAATGTQAGF